MTDFDISAEKKYDDIIHLPHPVSAKHPQMPLLDRAAQFAAFAALTGYHEAILETARRREALTESDGTDAIRAQSSCTGE